MGVSVSVRVRVYALCCRKGICLRNGKGGVCVWGGGGCPSFCLCMINHSTWNPFTTGESAHNRLCNRVQNTGVNARTGSEGWITRKKKERSRGAGTEETLSSSIRTLKNEVNSIKMIQSASYPTFPLEMGLGALREERQKRQREESKWQR